MLLLRSFLFSRRCWLTLWLIWAGAAASVNANTPQPDSDLFRAIRLLDQMENNLRYLKRGDVSGYNSISAKLADARKSLESSRSTDHPEYSQSLERWNALRERLQAIAAQWQEPEDAPPSPTAQPVADAPPPAEDTARTVNEAINTAFDAAAGVNATTFADPQQAELWDDALAQLRARAQPHLQDRLWGRKIQMNLKAFEARLNQARSAHAAEVDKVMKAEGKALTAQMWDRFSKEKLPPFSLDLEPEAMQAWGAYRRDLLEKTIDADLRHVEALYQEGKLSSSGRSSALSWVGNIGRSRVQEQVQGAVYRMDSEVQTGLQVAAWLAETDLNDRNQVLSRLTQDGAVAYNMERLNAGKRAIEQAAALDQGLGRTDGPDRSAQMQELQAGMVAFQQMTRDALASVVMPEAASTDAKLLRIAQTTLAKPDYESARGWERLVINSDLQKKEKWEGDYRRGTVQDTISVYHHQWDEFQVATAEQVGERYFIYYNRLKYFHSGGSTTPTGRWILSQRFQGSEILAENIQK
ncbi:MAG: hypothetical protein ACFB20_03415 [Opitutales bacterium]